MPAIDYSAHATMPAVQAQAPAVAKAKEADTSFGFDDILDIVNPLQHIPVISTIYRHLTGDKIGTPEKIAGDALYGGLTGLACSLGDTLFQEVTGKSVGDTVYAMVMGDDDKPAVASLPASDKITIAPASGYSFALPDFSFEDSVDAAPASTVSAQRAIAAYRSVADYQDAQLRSGLY